MVGHGQLRQYAGLLNDTAFADAALSEDSLPGSEAFWNGGSRSHRSPRGAPETGRGIPQCPEGPPSSKMTSSISLARAFANPLPYPEIVNPHFSMTRIEATLSLAARP